MRSFKVVAFSCLFTIAAHADNGVPAGNLWRLSNSICSTVEVHSSVTDDLVETMYDLLNDINNGVNVLNTSTLDLVFSLLDTLITDLDISNSLTEVMVSQIDASSSQLESVIDAISTLEGIEKTIVAGICSCIDSAVPSETSVLSSKIDVVQNDFDSCCSTLSLLDTIIKSDVDAVSSKVDSVATAVNSCCSTLSTMDQLIKSEVDTISSKIDVMSSSLAQADTAVDQMCSVVNNLYNCLVITPITQAMVPYTITQPGNYYLVGPVTAAGAPTITIAASNVYLDLQGNTVTSTNNVGIQCTGQDNISISNGTIIPFLKGVYVTNSSNIQIANLMVNAINGSTSANAIDIENSSFVTISGCVMDAGGSGSTNCIFLSQTGPARIVNSITSLSVVGITISNSPNNATVEVIGCIVAAQETCFVVTQTVNTQSNIIIRDCVAPLDNGGGGSGGFDLSATNNTFKGPILENCTALVISGGFSISGFSDVVLKNCTAMGCFAGYVFGGTANLLCQNCVAESNTIGMEVVGSSTDIIFDRCTAAENGTGYSIPSTASNILLVDCIASGSTTGISNASTTTFIVDSRSQHAANATTGNPAYNLNTNADANGLATIIVTS